MSWIMSQDGETLVNLAQCSSISVKKQGSWQVTTWPENVVIFSGSEKHCREVYRELAIALRPSKINLNDGDTMSISWFPDGVA